VLRYDDIPRDASKDGIHLHFKKSPTISAVYIVGTPRFWCISNYGVTCCYILCVLFSVSFLVR
jgi:hypothetical protein